MPTLEDTHDLSTSAITVDIAPGPPPNRPLVWAGSFSALLHLLLRNKGRAFSRAYLRHLVMANEILASTLLTLHNVRFYVSLMAAMREAIAAGGFGAFRARFFSEYRVS